MANASNEPTSMYTEPQDGLIDWHFIWNLFISICVFILILFILIYVIQQFSPLSACLNLPNDTIIKLGNAYYTCGELNAINITI